MWSSDTSIIAHGHVRPPRRPARITFVQAEVELPTGVGQGDQPATQPTRLPPRFGGEASGPMPTTRVRHRQQIERRYATDRSVAPSTPLIVGGDFFAPHDGALVST